MQSQGFSLSCERISCKRWMQWDGEGAQSTKDYAFKSEGGESKADKADKRKLFFFSLFA